MSKHLGLQSFLKHFILFISEYGVGGMCFSGFCLGDAVCVEMSIVSIIPSECSVSPL